MIALDATDPPSALPRGTRLAEFEIKRVLGAGGFGIVYLAFDHALEREVAIKEYMPVSMAGRTAAFHVSLLSLSHAESFSLGLRSFVNEARLLARFDHPSLVKVLRYWEHNNTAYMAMPYYTGSNLQAERRRMVRTPTEGWVRGILGPLLGALERLHREAVYHRDISPDNVILEPDGRPVLLDFGAARRVLADKSVALTAILKPAYAPIEQYGETGSVKQGPWTDLYALGATLHYLMLDQAPPPATGRIVHDEMTPLATRDMPGYSVAFLQCLDWMLQPRPADRPQSVADLQSVLQRLPPTTDAAARDRSHLIDLGEAPKPDLAWLPTQMPTIGVAAMAPTVLDLSRTPKTVLQPPAPDNRPTLVMPRSAAPDPDVTIVRPSPAVPGKSAAKLPASVAARIDPSLLPASPADPGDNTPRPASSPDTAAPVEPRLTPDAGAHAAPGAPQRKTASARWPLVAGVVGVAGLALWLGLKPPAAVPDAAALAPAASATVPLAAASAEPSGTAATSATPPATGQTAAQASASAPPAVRLAPSPALPATTAKLIPTPHPVALRPALAQPVPVPATTAATPSPGGSPGLATSITRLPPAAAEAVPTVQRPTSPPATAAPAALATPAKTAATLAAPHQPTPVLAPTPAPTAATVPTPAKTPDRDSEPVLVQARSLSPSERCEGRVLVSLWSCIERQCKSETSLRDHPECVKLRRDQERAGTQR